ncbi:hypothetical protein FHS31_002277 [Sphingomonas vulcanisoli]|uniref:Sel1 repeat family protein n=1 Tax=Sphingomonas vulcanisoli TaxID=1658060 RepID=A0ABX0TT20_9SPHN|nr:hypothetical protein [Sphingomonas vulcanisoli]NIJ08656.1 hypothetical protein [Sphingomonas vulcanisoli]
MRFEPLVCVIAAAAIMSPVQAVTPRDLLTQAAFQATDKRQALALVTQAVDQSQAILATRPNDHEGLLQNAMSIGYRATLTKKPADAKSSRKMFESLVASNPRDPEFQLAIGGWHLDCVAAGFLATTVLGCNKDLGLDGIGKAVSYGGNRAFFKGMAAMMRIRLDRDAVAASLALAQAAAAAPTPTALDRIAKHDAELMLVPLRAGDGKAASALAKKLLPFGRLG